MKLNVGILGGGSWGTTVASLTAKNNDTIMKNIAILNIYQEPN